MNATKLLWDDWSELPKDYSDPRFQTVIHRQADLLISRKFLSMSIYRGNVLSSDVVPALYNNEDIRLLLAKDNPIHLGWWFFNAAYGHENIGIGELVKMGFSAQQIKEFPVGYVIQ